MIPYAPEAYKLLHDGVRALSRVEDAGIRVDVEYLDKVSLQTKQKVTELLEKMEKTEVLKTWRKSYRGDTSLNSLDQLGDVLFNKMGFTPPAKTEGGRGYKLDEKTLVNIDHPFIPLFLRVRKLQKAYGTYLQGIRRTVVDGFCHPVFNLHLVQTYRSSCEDPNFQNIPVRDVEIMNLVRSAFFPRKGRQLVELDYGGIEVKVAACYHHDPTMITYLEDKSKDMHRDMAMECYLLKQADVSKHIRYCGKNMFVFPQFYGDWYLDCARSLWNAIPKMKLCRADGVSLLEHLAENGIRELGRLDPKGEPRKGTFEYHIKAVEKNFWNVRFPVYDQWRRDWYEDYKRKGWFQMLTGFVCQGYMKRNEVVNYPVQGSAFHCLLWSLIQLVNKELKRHNMETLIVGQIHDSIVADVVPEERDDFLALAKEVMINRLMKHWSWICVPMEIEAEVAPVDAPWALKEKVELN